MNEGESIRRLALALGPGGFAARFPFGFLVRRAAAADANANAGTDPPGLEGDDAGGGLGGEEEIAFSTLVLSKEKLMAAAEAAEEDDLASEDSPSLILCAVSKRRGNAFPDRISVGRTRNCDVVLRYPSVSKLHAHFHIVSGRVEQLTDYQSANGTFVNGERVPPGKGLPVKHGDAVRFGALELQYLTAEQVFAEFAKR